MNICHFGFFDPTYSRNAIMRESLEETGATVVACHAPKMNFGTLIQLFRMRPKKVDVVLVGYSDNRFGVLLAKLLFRVPVVWDAFYSLYDSRVHDRALVNHFDPRAWWYWLLDCINVFLANGYIFDTNEHMYYFQNTFGAQERKSVRVLFGSLAQAHTNAQYHENDTVGFYGKYIPLQGVEVIVRAAALLPQVSFELIGSGQEYAAMRRLSNELHCTNIAFVNRLSFDELVQHIESWSVSLGIFGSSQKAQRVIANKIYDAAALGKAIITMDTPAVRELFTHNQDIVLISNDPQSLAEAIKELLADEALRRRIGEAAKERVQTETSLQKTGKNLQGFFEAVIEKKV